jgi:hypothetical protein
MWLPTKYSHRVESNKVKKLNFWLPLKRELMNQLKALSLPLLLDGGRMVFSDASIMEFVLRICGVPCVAVHVSKFCR